MPRNIRPLVDPELLDLLEIWPPAGQFTAENLASLRANPIAAPPQPLSAAAATVKMLKRKVSGLQGAPDVLLHVYQPAELSGPIGCVYHMHGGGVVIGTVTQSDWVMREWCAELGCVIVDVEYRLAPETRFPGNIEDCYAGLAWTFQHATELGVDPKRIGVKGESGGGCLAASLALLARDRGEYPLAFQHLIYPMLDDRTCAADPHPFAGEFVVNLEDVRFCWSAILGVTPGSPGVSPYAAAARAENLAGLPPTFIATATLDLFIDENLEYARRLIRAGVPVELHVYPNAFHGFDCDPTAAVARRARRDSFSALGRFFGAANFESA